MATLESNPLSRPQHPWLGLPCGPQHQPCNCLPSLQADPGTFHMHGQNDSSEMQVCPETRRLPSLSQLLCSHEIQNSLVFADKMDSACMPSALLCVASSTHPRCHCPVPCTGVPSSWRAHPTPVLTVCPDLVGTLSLQTLSACHKTRP